MSRLLACLLIALLAPGCFIEPLEELGVASFSIDMPAQESSQAWDKQGRLHLAEAGAFVRVALQRAGEDYEQGAAVWPSGASKQASPELSISVAPGDYDVHAIAYAVENDVVLAFREADQGPVSLVAGKVSEMDLSTRYHGTGTVQLQLTCREVQSLPFISARVSLVDARARVVLPPLTVQGHPPSLSPTTFEGVPVGRPFQLRVEVEDEITQKTHVLELFAPLISLTNVGEHQAHVRKIPCLIGG